MFKRSTPIEEIEKIFSSENYKINELQIKKNYRLYITYTCPNDHIGEIRLDCFKSGRRCAQCYKNSTYYSYDQVKYLFESEGYKLLDETYKNIITHINFMCNKGHQGKMLMTHWLKGHRCRECGYEISAEKNRSKNPDRELLMMNRKLANSLRSNLKRFMNDSIGPNDELYKIHNYTPKDFINHIKNHPNYDNACKNGRLSIDHIFPIKAFQDYNICIFENAWIINGLDNLQPLDRFENSRKNCKYDKEKFLEFIIQKGIIMQ